ncbi:hypothetical protein [Streptomyces sp. NBC_01538]|uniref:hypothetical protein n=1 Tax=Streptomyces sp. NBC_01538 TaxID=2903897 RepID=UPI00386D0AD0
MRRSTCRTTRRWRHSTFSFPARPDLWIATGKRKGHNPSFASIYRALAEHEKTQTYPEAVEAAHADFATLQTEGQGDDILQPRHHTLAQQCS